MTIVASQPSQPRRRIVRTLLLAIVLVTGNLLLVELGLRAYFATKIGPSVLLYGTPWQRNWIETPPVPERDPLAASAQRHGNVVGDDRAYAPGATGYSKYFPHEKKWTQRPDGTGAIPTTINAEGFRGADFTIDKQPGTIRILTMGASSTFGYHDRDDETYPFLLERDLQATAPPGVKYEVINFAIPHATTDNVLAMLRNEGLRLSPDVVTFYEGANDCAAIEPRGGPQQEGFLDRAVRRSVLIAMLDRIVPRSNAVDADWWWSEEQGARRARGFVHNLVRLRDLCREHGIVFIVATQQFRSTLIPTEQLHGMTYDQELAFVREQVAAGKIGPHQMPISEKAFDLRLKADDELAPRMVAMLYPPRVMLVHAQAMAELRAWAARDDVPLADVIHALDGDRDLMVNWVHLTAAANAIVARELAGVIREQLAARPAPAGGRS
jgi:lysophospholipase L1-like esterase